MSDEIGYREGVQQGRDQALAEVEEFITQLLSTIPNVEAVTHYRMCYVNHPRCAALAVARRVRWMRGAADHG